MSMIERLKTPRGMREGQRDVTTVLCAAVTTICAKVFDLHDADLIGALTTVLIIICHRASPDIAGKK